MTSPPPLAVHFCPSKLSPPGVIPKRQSTSIKTPTTRPSFERISRDNPPAIGLRVSSVISRSQSSGPPRPQPAPVPTAGSRIAFQELLGGSPSPAPPPPKGALAPPPPKSSAPPTPQGSAPPPSQGSAPPPTLGSAVPPLQVLGKIPPPSLRVSGQPPNKAIQIPPDEPFVSYEERRAHHRRNIPHYKEALEAAFKNLKDYLPPSVDNEGVIMSPTRDMFSKQPPIDRSHLYAIPECKKLFPYEEVPQLRRDRHHYRESSRDLTEPYEGRNELFRQCNEFNSNLVRDYLSPYLRCYPEYDESSSYQQKPLQYAEGKSESTTDVNFNHSRLSAKEPAPMHPSVYSYSTNWATTNEKRDPPRRITGFVECRKF